MRWQALIDAKKLNKKKAEEILTTEYKYKTNVFTNLE